MGGVCISIDMEAAAEEVREDNGELGLPRSFLNMIKLA